jgi:hypothetical protein
VSAPHVTRPGLFTALRHPAPTPRAITNGGDFDIVVQRTHSAVLSFKRDDGHRCSANVAPTADSRWEVFTLSIAPNGLRYGRSWFEPFATRDEAAQRATRELLVAINFAEEP